MMTSIRIVQVPINLENIVLDINTHVTLSVKKVNKNDFKIIFEVPGIGLGNYKGESGIDNYRTLDIALKEYRKVLGHVRRGEYHLYKYAEGELYLSLKKRELKGHLEDYIGNNIVTVYRLENGNYAASMYNTLGERKKDEENQKDGLLKGASIVEEHQGVNERFAHEKMSWISDENYENLPRNEKRRIKREQIERKKLKLIYLGPGPTLWRFKWVKDSFNTD